MKLKTIAIILLAVASLQCTRKNDIITDNIRNAEIQMNYLLEASEAGDTIRIPSTYKNGEIEFVPTDDWVSGFFAGSLWYMYELTGDEKWAEHARKHTEILSEIQFLKWHHDVGFMVYDSYGNGLRLKNIPGYDTVLVNTAKSLATRFRPAAGILQSWNVVNNGWQSTRGWKCPVIIDNMMNLELLFHVAKVTGDDSFRKVAVSHAETTMKNQIRKDYSHFHVVYYDKETGAPIKGETSQGYADNSCWSRGQSWGIYGFTMCYRETGDKRFLKTAQGMADFYLDHPNLPSDKVALWDFNAWEEGYVPGVRSRASITPILYRDASAAACTASALLELSTYVKGSKSKKYFDGAVQILHSLAGPAYRAKLGENANFILMHSVGAIPHGSEIDVPLTYADYYFIEALYRYNRLLDGKPLF